MLEILLKKISLSLTLILALTNRVHAEEGFLNSARCKQEAEKVSALIKSSRACAKDEDCALEFFGCPWGCGTSINKSQVAKIKTAIRAIKNCTPCEYRCKHPEHFPQAGCREGVCVDVANETK